MWWVQTSGTAEGKVRGKASVSQLLYHLWFGGYRLQNGKKTVRAVKNSVTPTRCQDMSNSTLRECNSLCCLQGSSGDRFLNSLSSFLKGLDAKNNVKVN